MPEGGWRNPPTHTSGRRAVHVVHCTCLWFQRLEKNPGLGRRGPWQGVSDKAFKNENERWKMKMKDDDQMCCARSKSHCHTAGKKEMCLLRLTLNQFRPIMQVGPSWQAFRLFLPSSGSIAIGKWTTVRDSILGPKWLNWVLYPQERNKE